MPRVLHVPTVWIRRSSKIRLRAFEATLLRPGAQCASGRSDVYGAQQHVPLMNM
ncbi:DUF4387 family protein [Bradyrhizobium sp. S3.12.5]|uniref:DUF4387 family protein n=1 Tax=Bradyrhizobium sp. S3.12.5 TaxID=3156386 RepID=UPI00339416F6